MREAFIYVKKGFQNIIYGDIANPSDTLVKMITEVDFNKWDYLIIGEMFHEIDDPIGLLRNVHERYRKHIKRLIVTVPNLYRLTNIKMILRGIDGNHTENRFWYSPYSLCKVVAVAGYGLEDIYVAGISYRILRRIIRKGICGENIIITARF